jgi:hypothetical protein
MNKSIARKRNASLLHCHAGTKTITIIPLYQAQGNYINTRTTSAPSRSTQLAVYDSEMNNAQ